MRRPLGGRSAGPRRPGCGAQEARGATIRNPSFYIGGTLDLIAGNTPEAIDTMRGALPDLRHCELLPGAGHWIQQERPDEVNAALLGFLRSIDG